MKTIAQLLHLKENPHYKFTKEEQKLIDDFLETQSVAQSQPKNSSTSSSPKTPAIVHSKNRMNKEIGEVPIE